MPFPLPLTPFERYYLTDDRPQYPTTIPAELRFSGRLEQEPFRAAVERLVARHPLLGALVEDSPAGPQWIAGAAREVCLDWAAEPCPLGHPDGEYLDLRRVPGFRVWVRIGNDASRVVLQVHHACCDGLSVLQLIGDLVVLYAAECGGAESVPALRELSAERLRERGLFDVGAEFKPTPATALRDIVVTMRVWRRILFEKCLPLAGAERRVDRRALAAAESAAADRAPSVNDTEFLAFESRVLTPDVLQRFKDVAKARGVTLNDLLLRDMLLVARDWNQSHGATAGGPLRINMPVYVRGRLGRDIPASNGIGFAFVTTDPDRFADAGALLKEVHEQTQRIKRWKLALYFLGGLGAAARFPRVMRRVLARNKALATVVLSYLGPAMQGVPLPRRDGKLVCGNVVLEQMAGVPPVRPLTRASIVVVEYAKALTIALRTDAHCFRAADTRALLDAYAARLSETAATAE